MRWTRIEFFDNSLNLPHTQVFLYFYLDDENTFDKATEVEI